MGIHITKLDYETNGVICGQYLFMLQQDTGLYKRYMIQRVELSTGDLVVSEK